MKKAQLAIKIQIISSEFVIKFCPGLITVITDFNLLQHVHLIRVDAFLYGPI